MKTIVLASNNKHKIKEISEMITDYNIVTMREIGFDQDIAETGTTFVENAMIKARTIRQYLDELGLDYYVLSDDSGLICNGLNGDPGVYSARYASLNATDEENRQKLLRELAKVDDRTASFTCCMVLLNAEGKSIVGVGETKGEILREYAGNTEFCYDCLFYSYELGKSFGEATEEEKNSVSHRAKAVHNLLKSLANNEWRVMSC